MKAATIIKKMLATQTASIAQTELLTKALHRENKLPQEQAIRFMLLYGKFDIVNADLWTTGKFNPELCEGSQMSIDELAARFI